MALRGVRPSIDDLRAIIDDPDKLEGFVDGYVESPLFSSRIKDLENEWGRFRTVVPLSY